jgi:hypothetical protein
MSNKTIDINESTIKNFVESIRPQDPKIRQEVDMGYSYDGKTVIFYEIRFYKSRQEWNLYWMRASGKWELYEPYPESSYLDKLLAVIKEDKHACFFG